MTCLRGRLGASGGAADGGEDTGIAAAAAEAAVEGLDDLGVGGAGGAIEEGGGAEGHAAGAVAALHGAFVEEGLLDAVEGTGGGEAFDGGDSAAGGGADGSDAGDDWAVVEEDGACPALTLAAAILRAGEGEIFAKDIEEWAAGVGLDAALSAVDGEAEAGHGSVAEL
jgi:hypothetical protein